MSSPTSLHESRIVDNQDAPVVPNRSHFGRSRVGRKALRKVLDAYHVALRRHEGRPAKSGPPIPNSEKHGRRSFYTLHQADYGRRKGLETRRRRAAPKRRAVQHYLDFTRLSYRRIGELVGYTGARICQLAKEFRAATVKVLNLHVHHQPPASDTPAPTSPRNLTLMLLYSNQIINLLKDSRPLPVKTRYEGLLYAYQKGSYKARLKQYISALHHRVSPEAATVALAEAFEIAEKLSQEPIDKAVRKLNKSFGWC